MKKQNKNNNLSFEEHLVRAKDIIHKLELGECSLDEMLLMYKDGVESLNHCSKKLNEFEDKIEIIKKNNFDELKD